MADSPNRIMGRATITVDGKRLATKPGAEWDPTTGERSPEMGEFAPEGFTEKAKAAMLKVDVFKKPGITASSLYAIKDATVEFVGDDGYTGTLVAATVLKVGPIKTGGGGATWSVEMFGMTANEASS